ncbi:hypothetical protein FOCC_FOCC013325 [Frankliniella occidentalis]|nr:hypothetical protein FOCC_FOCC013325 [Frankliniella occidentalis]
MLGGPRAERAGQGGLIFDLRYFDKPQENHVVTHWSPSEKILLHFYAIEVSQETLREIEREALKSHDYGTEVMGTFRVPLYTMSDGQRGFPTFLRNSFVGNAYHQLRRGLLQSSIMSEEEIRTAEAISQKMLH